MSEFTVQLTRAAQKDLNRLDLADRKQIDQGLVTLKENPLGRPPRIKRLRGFPFPLYRLRSGDFRILYRIDEMVVTIMRVIERKYLEVTIRHLGARQS